MLGTIYLKNMHIECIIGELEYERTTLQTLLLDVTYVYDISNAIAHDDITAAVDYSTLSRQLADLIVASKFKLLETLCAECCTYALQHFPQIHTISIQAKKPDALHTIDLCCAECTLSNPAI